MRILVGENDPAMLELLESNLGQWGYEVVPCMDGAEAWQVLQEDDPPKLAVLEWNLPGMDGPELCRKVRDVGNRPYIYIILLTEERPKSEVLGVLEAGADEYIVKPLDIRELQVRVGAGSRVVGLQDTFMCVLKLSELEAAHDPLTGLWNRAAIADLLRRELARSDRHSCSLAIIAAGLDQFKRIDDNYGPLTSDAILREVVLRIHSTVRTYDSVGRVADEDFIIVAPGCDEAEARGLAERLTLAVARYRATIGGERIPLSMSAGVVAVAGAKELRAETLIDAAEAALEKARGKGTGKLEMVQLVVPA